MTRPRDIRAERVAFACMLETLESGGRVDAVALAATATKGKWLEPRPGLRLFDWRLDLLGVTVQGATAAETIRAWIAEVMAEELAIRTGRRVAA